MKKSCCWDWQREITREVNVRLLLHKKEEGRKEEDFRMFIRREEKMKVPSFSPFPKARALLAQSQGTSWNEGGGGGGK